MRSTPGGHRGAYLVVAAVTLAGCGGTPQECVDAAQVLAPAAIAFVDDLPAGVAAADPAEIRTEIDDRSGRTLDQALLELNRFGLGGIDPAPGQDPAELRAALALARDTGCEVGDLRPTLADAFDAAADDATGEASRRYRVVARALRPAG